MIAIAIVAVSNQTFIKPVITKSFVCSTSWMTREIISLFLYWSNNVNLTFVSDRKYASANHTVLYLRYVGRNIDDNIQSVVLIPQNKESNSNRCY